MEKFLALPKEKQDAILEAGYACFAQVGYKKSSVADIAAKAGISKAMIFHYFGSKKNMYFYMLEHATEEVERIFSEHVETNHTDCFQRFMEENRLKAKVLQKHPALIAFLLSTKDEEDEEVRYELSNLRLCKKIVSAGEWMKAEDLFQLKEGIKPEFVIHLLTNYVENIARKAAFGQISDMEKAWEEVNECIVMLKSHLLKNPNTECE